MSHHAESRLPATATAVLLAAVLGISAAARAQGFLEEIVVTAQKRSENLQDVPMSISALEAEALEAGRVEKIGELALRIPNLSYSTFSSGRSELTVRGIGNSGATRSGLENSVILFVDEVYIARSTSYFFELFDLEQASVLRGPQGVLFGKNVVGGAINLTTRAPNVEGAEGKVPGGLWLVQRRRNQGRAFRPPGSQRRREDFPGAKNARRSRNGPDQRRRIR